MFSSSRPSPSNQQPESIALGKYENRRLNKVMGTVELHSKNAENRAIRIDLKVLLQKLFGKLNHYEVPGIENAFLVGGGASYVLNPRCPYSDIDICIPVRLANYWSAQKTFAFIRKSVLELIQELSHGVRDPVSYLEKVILISLEARTNYWSLFALRNEGGRHVELKFVLSIPREYIFFSDSIKIDLTNFAKNNRVPRKERTGKENCVPLELGSNQKAGDAEPNGNVENMEYLPSKISSYYKDLKKAISDVKNRSIDTVEPEKIRGGGFLKYAHLKSKGFIDAREGSELEKLLEGMVSGFHQEFKDSKYDVLSQYVRNHFEPRHFPKKFKFLEELKSLCSHLEKRGIKNAMETQIEKIREGELGKMAILRAASRRPIVMPLLDADGFDYCSHAAHPFFPYL